jgi:hypothetical protein
MVYGTEDETAARLCELSLASGQADSFAQEPDAPARMALRLIERGGARIENKHALSGRFIFCVNRAVLSRTHADRGMPPLHVRRSFALALRASRLPQYATNRGCRGGYASRVLKSFQSSPYRAAAVPVNDELLL